ncbi:MAG TPA: long-chain fatty acid--CoA ligase [Candidatus Thermoplasmatota archaeon]|nr:long-chain fatty acid--CoA ligase [Candidatus Thermoplasmatota archaeon]
MPPLRVLEGPPLDIPQGNVATLFLDAAAAHADEVGFEWRDASGLHAWTYREVEARVREVASGLLALGIRRGDRVAILADTRPEWALADLAIQMAGAVTTTLFTTLAADQVEFLLRDSQSRALFVDSPTQWKKLHAIATRLDVEAIVALDAADPGPDLAKRTLTLDALRAQGRLHAAANPGLLDQRAAEPKHKDPSTIIYTSGTTGVPKGAVLSHLNCVSAARMPTRAFHLDTYDRRKTAVFLPLAHSLTRAVFLNAIDLGARIGFTQPKTLTDDLRAMRPRLIASAPRIYERIHDQYLATAASAPPLRRRIMERARGVAIDYGRALADGGRAPALLAARRAFYDKLVYAKLREKVGWSELEMALSGAAAIRPELLYFFRGVGIVIVEAWGLTETSAPGTTNPTDRVRPGTVGTPFPGVSIALDEDNEILVHGPNVFLGYHERPEETAEAFVLIDGKRWFRTGDIGRIDEAGYLKIVDRKKEIEVLDTGKKISPIFVEETLKTVSPYVGEACLVGTGRKFAGALIQPNLDRLVGWAREQGIPFDERALVVRPDATGSPMTYTVGGDLVDAPEVRALFEGEVAKANAKVADYERIRAFRLVPNVFSIERDELTITLKKKRRVILANYKDEIESMFRHEAR